MCLFPLFWFTILSQDSLFPQNISFLVFASGRELPSPRPHSVIFSSSSVLMFVLSFTEEYEHLIFFEYICKSVCLSYNTLSEQCNLRMILC